MSFDGRKNKMPVQSPEERINNFNEVALGYDEETAVSEANRCLNCKNSPCIKGCPVNIKIPSFIAAIKERDFEKAYSIISESSSLPAICGRVCPQEKQCEQNCTLGIKSESVRIGRLERFVADRHNNYSKITTTNTVCTNIGDVNIGKTHRIAVVGSGPSGLSCAAQLAKTGYKVTVYEALHTPGGVLVYGIPEFRLPKKIVLKEIEGLKNLGVDFQTNVVIGKTLTVDELFKLGYEAVFIGTGAGLPKFMNIVGEDLNGVYSANEYLTRINLMKSYKEDFDTPVMKSDNVAVVGGGNVAMDAARTALRLGAKHVYCIYRRTIAELPARVEEVKHAEEEGVEFHFLTNPVEILGYNNPDNIKDEKNGFVKGIKCIKMQLGEPDEKGRRRPIPVAGSEVVFNVDTVIMALGTSPNPLIKNTTDNLLTNENGGIIVNEDGLTSCKAVYAGGDAVTGASTVISAMGAGKVAAKAIYDFLENSD